MSNRRKIKLILKNLNQNWHKLNLLLVLILFLGIGLACSSNKSTYATHISDNLGSKTENKPRHLESYEVRGFKFSYYLIPKQLNNEELFSTAQEIHEKEPDAQLILVDDDSQIAGYIAYAKDVSNGNTSAKMPKEWADKHIIGNVQKYLSGKWMLCEGNGYREIAELK